MYLWRAVDDEGEVLDLVVQRRRDTEAALKLLRRLLRNQPVEPEWIVTDGLGSYAPALDELGLRHLHRPGRLRENNRVENGAVRLTFEVSTCGLRAHFPNQKNVAISATASLGMRIRHSPTRSKFQPPPPIVALT